MSIQLDREITQDFARATGLEWLETNGLGGWAGTTVAGAHSRRYHGLLVAATLSQSPAERIVLLSRLDETLHVEGASFDLGCNQFPGTVSPRGFEYLTAFRKDLFPVFNYEAGGVKLRKTVAAVDGENTTLVLYEVLEAPGPFILSLRPFLAARDQHVLSTANSALSQETPFADGVLRVRPYPEVPELFVAVPGADFRPNPQWWYRFEYELDRRTGRDFQEDLWTPGLFGLELAPGDRLGIVISTGNPAGRDAFALFEKEKKRREKILKSLPVQDELARFLALAGDGFLARRGSTPFGEYSRDTLIALPGLYLATGRFEEAKKNLRILAKSLHKGLLPDRQGKGQEPEITSPDASLWLGIAAWKYLAATSDEAFVRETLLPALRKVIYACEQGTFPGIRVEEDGLLAVDEGKSVEVNALWFNALSIQAEIEARLGDAAEAKTLAQRARRVQKRFQEVFWNEEAGFLYDAVNGEERDAALRPNQLFALSLPFPLLPKPRAARVLAAVEEKLYTPVGLRTLEPGHPDYDVSSYHQGAVWAWLLGPYYSALVRVHGAAGRKKALAALAELRPRLVEAGVASLPEVFDPEPARSPRGSIARAWGVAEVLRAYVEDLQPGEPKAKKEAVAPVAPEPALAPKAAKPAPKPARGRAKK
ncbi:MAG TPA: glycogen debranching enzyme N-terminal domain-containing protein [Thermoanaerobaculia bacterium]|jgi:predicted glycogen debranching enzyme|nr:glycogen debranching enzyme N-terminal domain-containing protein [Thermoanaerobaculia bacterium]